MSQFVNYNDAENCGNTKVHDHSRPSDSGEVRRRKVEGSKDPEVGHMSPGSHAQTK
jgi:hypothetical protein